jgi:hypothetical protein
MAVAVWMDASDTGWQCDSGSVHGIAGSGTGWQSDNGRVTMTEYIDRWRSAWMAVAESGSVTGSVAMADSVPVTESGSVHGIAGSGTGWQSDKLQSDWQGDNGRVTGSVTMTE